MRKPTAITAIVFGLALTVPFGVEGQQTQATGTQNPPATSSQKTPSTAQKPATSQTATKTTPAAKKPTAPALTTDKQKGSYALGVNIGKSMTKQAPFLDADSMARGLKDGLAGATPLLSDADLQAALNTLRDQVTKEMQAEQQKLGEDNMREGQEFLAANKTKDGVVTLPSGLQYKILTVGTGPMPTASDTVVCNYRGTLINGTEFDSSYKRGQPATFPLRGVIKGWTEALQLMPTGSKWQLFIPPDLAYGPRGAGNVIGPNATLIFEIELISIQGKPQSQAAPPPQAQPSSPAQAQPATPPPSASPKQQ